MSFSAYAIRWGGPASTLAGVAWILLWGMALLAHEARPGASETTVLGLTHFDWTKLTVVPVAGFMAGMMALNSRQRKAYGRIGRLGFLVALIALGLMLAGIGVGYWPFPWGIYPDWWQADLFGSWNGILFGVGFLGFMLSGVILCVGLILLGISAKTGNRRQLWRVMLFVAGVSAVLPLVGASAFGSVGLEVLAFTLPWMLFGLAWAALGLTLWRTNPETSQEGLSWNAQ